MGKNKGGQDKDDYQAKHRKEDKLPESGHIKGPVTEKILRDQAAGKLHDDEWTGKR